MFEIAAYQICGRRDEQQDAYSITKIGDMCTLVGVYDGHGDHGAEIAKAVAELIPKHFAAAMPGPGPGPTTDAISEALCRAFSETDAAIRADPALRDHAQRSGTTAVVVAIIPTHFVTASAGDSRAVLLRHLAAVPGGAKGLVCGPQLSIDHDIYNSAEVTRARAVGGKLDGEYFVVKDEGLQVSRALGDFLMHPIVTAVPDIGVHRRTPGDDAYLWLFSDGITEAMLNYGHEWYAGVAAGAAKAGVIAVARAIVEDAFDGISPGKPLVSPGAKSNDNITCVVAKIPRHLRSTVAVTRRVGVGAGVIMPARPHTLRNTTHSKRRVKKGGRRAATEKHRSGASQDIGEPVPIDLSSF